MREEMQDYDVVAGRDERGRLWFTQVPPGLAGRGMFVRLLGGRFILVESARHLGRIPEGRRQAPAVELLGSVWGGA